MAPKCISCERSNTMPSQVVKEMCTRCWLNLPQVTRLQYTNGGLTVKRVAELSRVRNASLKQIARRNG